MDTVMKIRIDNAVTDDVEGLSMLFDEYRIFYECVSDLPGSESIFVGENEQR